MDRKNCQNMFKSHNCECKNLKDPFFIHTIIDSDFTEKIIINNFAGDWAFHLNLIIDLYENKNANVAANLAKILLFWSKPYDQAVILKENQNNPKFLKYKNDIEKYLLLI